jgi:hypothetical protein
MYHYRRISALQAEVMATTSDQAEKNRLVKNIPSHSGILKAMHSMVAEVLYVLSGRRFLWETLLSVQPCHWMGL